MKGIRPPRDAIAPDGMRSTQSKVIEAGILSLCLMIVSLPRALPEISARMFSDTDDAARLAQVRDLIAGQSWFDLSQHRLGLNGSPMHWTRLWDAVLAAPVVLLRGLLGPNQAETVAMIVAPTVVLLCALLLSGKIATHLAGEGAWLPAVATALVVPFTTTRLSPGAIDDHGFQVMLVLTMMAGLLDRRPGWIATAGAAGGLSLIVGVDTVPIIAAVFVAIGVHWVLGRSSAAPFRTFPAWLVAVTLIGGLLLAPPSRLVGRSCQVLSLPFVIALAGTAVTFWILIPRRDSPRLNWSLLALGGLATIGVSVAVAPACLMGVYADLPAAASDDWLQYVAELQPIDFSAGMRLVDLGTILAPVIGLAAAGISLHRQYHWKWLLLSSTMTISVILGVWQRREAASAGLLAAPVCGAVIWTFAKRFAPVNLRSAVVILSPLIVSGTLFVFAGNQLQVPSSPADGPTSCRTAETLDELSALERSVIVSDVDYGATLLIRTPHQIVAAPYHLNADGVVLAHEILTSPTMAAASLAREHGVTLIVDCHGAPLLSRWSAEGGLLHDLRSGSRPSWLTVVVDRPGLTAYQVVDQPTGHCIALPCRLVVSS